MSSAVCMYQSTRQGRFDQRLSATFSAMTVFAAAGRAFD
jgi:hypothetical protein